MHTYEPEALAVVESLERFKYYVYRKSIKVITDCSALRTAILANLYRYAKQIFKKIHIRTPTF